MDLEAQMKRNPMYLLCFAAALSLSLASLAPAQSLGQALGNALNQFFNPQNEAASVDQLRSFDRFLQYHQEIATELGERPERVNDREYVEHHPELREWLERHPEAARTFSANPDEFMRDERHYRYYNQDFQSGDRNRGEMAHFDWFLDGHPEIRSDLMRRPELANRGEYLEHHPELREFLERHPEIRERLQDHPREFMDREARLDEQRNDRYERQ